MGKPRPCKPCAAGTYAADRGAAHCVWCPPGRYTFATDKERRRCRTCPGGRAVRDAWQRGGARAFQPAVLACVFCGAGRFRDATAAGRSSSGGSSSSSRTAAATATATATATAAAANMARHSLDRTSPAANARCERCPRGRFQKAAGAPRCEACPAGKWTTASVDASGRPTAFDGLSCAGMCAGGRYVQVQLGLKRYGGSGSVRHRCLPCPLGRFAPHPGAAVCAPCAWGRFAAQPGTEACKACPAGRVAALWLGNTDFRFVPRPHAAAPAPPVAPSVSSSHPLGGGGGGGGGAVDGRGRGSTGSAARAAGGSTCAKPCASSAALREPAVVSLTSDGRVTCDACPAGRFKRPADFAACTACPRGKYRRAQSRLHAGCTDCPPGRTSRLPGATHPTGTDVHDCSVACAPGRYARAGTLCKACERGRAQRKAGAAACVQCAAGRFASTASADAAAATAAVVAGRNAGSSSGSGGGGNDDSFARAVMEGATECRACPAGAASTEGSVACLKCPAGRFASPPVGSFACVHPRHCVCADREHGVRLNVKKGAWCTLQPSSTLVAAPQLTTAAAAPQQPSAAAAAGAAAAHPPPAPAVTTTRMVSRLPCALADGSLVVVVAPGAKAQGIDLANAFVAPQRHGALCQALAPIVGGGGGGRKGGAAGGSKLRPPCSNPKCSPSERFGEWSPCTRGCGGGWTKRDWFRGQCVDLHVAATGYRCAKCRPHMLQQEQSRPCNTKPCPCVRPPLGRGALSGEARSWLSDTERRQILRQMADLGVWLAGSPHCRESERQLRLCRQDAHSAARTAVPGLTAALCSSLRARYRDCAAHADAAPCRLAHRLPTWVWLPPPSLGTHAKPMTWSGYRGWEGLKEVVDKVDELSTRLRVEADEAHPEAPALIAATEPPASIGYGNRED